MCIIYIIIHFSWLFYFGCWSNKLYKIIIYVIVSVLSLFFFVANFWTGFSNAKRGDSEEPEINKDYYKPREFEKYVVAADNIICSKMGKGIIRQGGSAADAIVTTHCCTEIVNSHSTGLGGGGFLLYYDKETGISKMS